MAAPNPGSVGRIFVGTTSWADKSLLTQGHFYPSSATTPEQRLRYYAGVFPVVEVDSSFYAIPAQRNAALWSERTPSGFVFDVKAYRLLTQHRTPIASLPADLRAELEVDDGQVYYEKVPEPLRAELWRRFRSTLEPLRAADRLGVVLFQFAPWMVFGKDGIEHIASCAEHMAGFHMAVELRNVSWLGDKHRAHTLRLLREHGLVHVVVDEPQDTSFSVPAVWEVTSPDVVVFRLHGRNRQLWQRRGLSSAAERFVYRYQDAELDSFVAPVRRLAEHAKAVHVLFNNCHSDDAQRNAVRFRELLQSSE